MERDGPGDASCWGFGLVWAGQEVQERFGTEPEDVGCGGEENEPGLRRNQSKVYNENG